MLFFILIHIGRCPVTALSDTTCFALETLPPARHDIRDAGMMSISTLGFAVHRSG